MAWRNRAIFIEKLVLHHTFTMTAFIYLATTPSSNNLLHGQNDYSAANKENFLEFVASPSGKLAVRLMTDATDNFADVITNASAITVSVTVVFDN